MVASWSQTTDDVLIKVQVPPATRGRDIKFDLHPKRMSVELDGRPLLAGSLSDVGEVKVDGEGLVGCKMAASASDLPDACHCASTYQQTAFGLLRLMVTLGGSLCTSPCPRRPWDTIPGTGYLNLRMSKQKLQTG